MSDEVFEKGIEIREAMFGPAGGRRKVEAADDFTRPFEDVVTNYCFGSTWSRPGLDLAQRSMVTLATLLTLGRPWEIKVHTQGALANGVTKEQIREICLQVGVYAGIPACGEGLRLAAEVLDSLEVE
jgi:4-carboxymuconolactone decarboxylase